jgi:hypothetical protein
MKVVLFMVMFIFFGCATTKSDMPMFKATVIAQSSDEITPELEMSLKERGIIISTIFSGGRPDTVVDPYGVWRIRIVEEKVVYERMDPFWLSWKSQKIKGIYLDQSGLVIFVLLELKTNKEVILVFSQNRPLEDSVPQSIL